MRDCSYRCTDRFLAVGVAVCCCQSTLGSGSKELLLINSACSRTVRSTSADAALFNVSALISRVDCMRAATANRDRSTLCAVALR
eukprot:1260280-Pleurochrysis_carterae.AAC.2